MKYRTPRALIRMTVGVLRHGRRETAYVMDIAEGGMKLQGLQSPVIGEVLRIHAKGAVFECQVSWVAGQFCGVQFCESQSPGDLRRFMGALPQLGSRSKIARPHYQEYGTGQAR